MQLYVKRLRPDAILPVRATEDSAGMDLFACMDAPFEIQPGEIRIVPTGIAAAPDWPDVALLVYARSGLAAKHGIALANGVGVVDSDYRGEIQVPLCNLGRVPFQVTPGMRIAQLVITPVLLPSVTETDTLPDTPRGTGGFGSTGC